MMTLQSSCYTDPMALGCMVPINDVTSTCSIIKYDFQRAPDSASTADGHGLSSRTCHKNQCTDSKSRIINPNRLPHGSMLQVILFLISLESRRILQHVTTMKLLISTVRQSCFIIPKDNRSHFNPAIRLCKRIKQLSRDHLFISLIIIFHCLTPLVSGMGLDTSVSVDGRGVNSLVSNEHSPRSSSSSADHHQVRIHLDSEDDSILNSVSDNTHQNDGDLDNNHDQRFIGNHVHPEALPTIQQQANAISRRNYNNENLSGHFHVQFYGPQGLHNNQLLNFTLLLQELGQSCSTYCADQIQVKNLTSLRLVF